MVTIQTRRAAYAIVGQLKKVVVHSEKNLWFQKFTKG